MAEPGGADARDEWRAARQCSGEIESVLGAGRLMAAAPGRLASAVLAIAIVACGESAAPGTSLSVAPDSATVLVGGTLALQVTVGGQPGGAGTGAVTYRSSNPAIARVSAQGLVTGVAGGAATITAEAGDRTADVAVRVRWGRRFGPDGGELDALGGSVQVQVPAAALDDSLTLFVDTAGAPPVDPRALPGPAYSLSPATFGFDEPVLVTLHYPAGAVAPGLESSVALYRAGTALWQAVNGSVLDAGTRSVTAPVSQLGVFGLLAPGPVASITVIPDTVVVVIGTTQPFRAELRDAAGGVLTNRSIAWASDDTTILRIDQSGVATGTAFGIGGVSASSGGASAHARVYVSFICSCAPRAHPGWPDAGAAACACAP